MSLVATAPLKNSAGQSPLQVAYRNGQFEIVALLLTHGADPNFIEHTGREPWAMPVLHHAITAAVMRSRWLAQTRYEVGGDRGWVTRNSVEQADAAFAALQLLFESGADIQGIDSYGNSVIARAVLDARQILPSYKHSDPDWVDLKPLNAELVADLSRVFDLLIERGADLDEIDPQFGKSVREFYRAEPVARFLFP